MIDPRTSFEARTSMSNQAGFVQFQSARFLASQRKLMLLQKNSSIAVDRRHISVGSASLFDEGLIVSLNRLANLRLSVPFLLLILHQSIREQLDFRKDLRTA